MQLFEAYINDEIVDRIAPILKENWLRCNQRLQDLTGILGFFETENDYVFFKNNIENRITVAHEPNRSEYGDFQTNDNLAQKIVALLSGWQIQPDVIIEPTFGKGSFIMAALKTFESVKTVIGIEIYKPYIWQTKFLILEYFLDKPKANKPIIQLYHQNIFDFEFDKLKPKGDILVLGNPPWVTNAMLSALGSDNLPKKSNFKNHSGYDAITGKGNFDIGEYISLMLIKAFHSQKGHMAFLVKNAVVKNILQEQKRNQFQISNIQKHIIDAQKEFNVATDAALFHTQFGKDISETCKELNLYTQEPIKKLGWVNDKFVANTEGYESAAFLDGNCPFEWRQGVKHDCSKIMELEQKNGYYINGNGESIDLEQDLVYGILKSSHLKQSQIATTIKYTIITQRKIGQNTAHIETYYPKTWDYLFKNKTLFDNRKSSIYNGKPSFSIFGIGDYSFAPYKVAISGMYKTSTFSLVLMQNNKPIMLDDTCYFIGFDNLQDALITQAILNLSIVQAFLQSIIFWDSKRAITKEVLRRIDIKNAIKHIQFEDIQSLNDQIIYTAWEKYKQQLETSNQLTIF